MKIGAQPQPVMPQHRPLGQQLNHSASHDADGQGRHRNGKLPAQKQGAGNDGEIEKKGRESRQEKVAVDVERTGHQRQEADEEDVGEHDAVQVVGQGQLAGDIAEAVADQANDRRRAENAEDGDDRHDEDQQRPADVDDPPRLLASLAVVHLREGRNEGRRQRSLGEKTAQQVRDGKGHEEGIGGVTGAEEPTDHHVPCQAGHPAEHRRRSHDPGRLGNGPLLCHVAPF